MGTPSEISYNACCYNEPEVFAFSLTHRIYLSLRTSRGKPHMDKCLFCEYPDKHVKNTLFIKLNLLIVHL